MDIETLRALLDIVEVAIRQDLPAIVKGLKL
jgi:hypothetical protein